MNFFYEINTVDVPAGTQFSMLDINSGYLQACSLVNPKPVTPSQPCDANPTVTPPIPFFTPSWVKLRDAEDTRLGPGTDKANRFHDSARTFGVDDN